MRFSKMLKGIEKVWDLWNILYQSRNFSSKKILVNRRFKASCLQMSPIPRDTPSLLLLGITIALFCCTVHAVVNDREEGRNTGNDKGGNEQHYSSFPAHKNK